MILQIGTLCIKIYVDSLYSNFVCNFLKNAKLSTSGDLDTGIYYTAEKNEEVFCNYVLR